MTNSDLHHYATFALRKIGETEVAEIFSIQWNPKMRSAAGRAKLTEWAIDINPKLLPFGEKEVNTTILHELAHLIAWKRNRHRGHGTPWRVACSDLGIPNESVTHTLPLPRRSQRKKFRYQCDTCGSSFDRVRRLTRPSACKDYLLKELHLQPKK